ncbi:sensor histidine kinase [Algoriphagus namhaensis]|uniref:Sensor histidine kinase n=1 Tax=Algoriphagus namhaensis TaxID=915353 RepID=A0ABV8AWA7_9BACT
MKNQLLNFRKIEWQLMTFVFLVIILVNVLGGNMSRMDYQSGFRYFAKVLIPAIFFGSFYLVHVAVYPNFRKTGKFWPFLTYCVLIFVFSMMATGLLSYGAGFSESIFQPFFLTTVALYLGYLVITFLMNQIFLPPRFPDFQLYNTIRLVLMFFFLLIFLISFRLAVSETSLIIFLMIIPASAVLVLYNYYFVYNNKKKGKLKRSRIFNWGLSILILLTFLIIAASSGAEEALLVGMAAVAFIQLLVFPLSNMAFDRYSLFEGQVNELNIQVNQGSANLSFLKSQINPHFLFNALNTLYGSALVENAEKTSDGIQKLGDMMRFMLHENLQDQISVKREIEYLQNYLNIQLLRFGKEPNLDLDIQIQEDFCEGQIAPMMLIPFIENAFKHGISTKSKSWIKINLRCMKGSIHLDVVNSVHPKKAMEDPKDESGVGLENVQKRLELLYPNKHKLTIVGNDSEHFVHFSLQIG